MIKNPDFEQDYWSRTARAKYKIGHVAIRTMKWLIYSDRSYYDNMKNFDLIGSIVKSIRCRGQR